MDWTDLFGTKAVNQDFTERTISAFFDEVDQDPLAGLGTLTKRAKLIDRIVAQHKIVLAQRLGITPQKPKPVASDELVTPQPTLDLRAAMAAKKAGM